MFSGIIIPIRCRRNISFVLSGWERRYALSAKPVANYPNRGLRVRYNASSDPYLEAIKAKINKQ